MCPTVVIVGTLDTKGEEVGYLRKMIQQSGCSAVVVDVGVLSSPTIAPDFTRDQVASAGGSTLTELLQRKDRRFAIETMTRGGASIVQEKYLSHTSHPAANEAKVKGQFEFMIDKEAGRDDPGCSSPLERGVGNWLRQHLCREKRRRGDFYRGKMDPTPYPCRTRDRRLRDLSNVITIAKSFVRLRGDFSRVRIGNVISHGHGSVTEHAQPGECLTG